MTTDPAARVQEILASHELAVLELPDETATAEQAASAVGCEVRQIVKSLLLVGDEGHALVLAAGDRRLDLDVVAPLLGQTNLRMARAAEVKDLAGFSIGAVPPLGHPRPIPTFMDARLLESETIYAAAGTRFRVFRVKPQDLLTITNSRLIDVGTGLPGS